MSDITVLAPAEVLAPEEQGVKFIFQSDWFLSLVSKTKTKIHQTRTDLGVDTQQLAYRKLRKDLSKVIELARAHANANQPAGSPVYQQLVEQACTLVTAYTTEHGEAISSEQMEFEMPELIWLAGMTQPAKFSFKPLVLGISGFVGVPIALAGIVALFQWGLLWFAPHAHHLIK